MIQLDSEKTTVFLDFVRKLHSQNWGVWPDASSWPDIGIDYTIFQQAADNGRHVTVVKFDRPVRLHGYRGASRRWAAGPGGRRMRDTMGLGF